MKTPLTIRDRFVGSVVGGALGDSLGAVAELVDAERAYAILGGDWVDTLREFSPKGQHFGAHATWARQPRRGTGTDDTRLNHLLIETAIEFAGNFDSQVLAQAYIDRFEKPSHYYPQYADLARENFEHYYPFACRRLGLLPDGSPANDRSLPLDHGEGGWGYGLISLAYVGLLHPNNPSAAYLRALELDFVDTGYAKDATAMFASILSLAVSGLYTPRETIDIVLGSQPAAIAAVDTTQDRDWHRYAHMRLLEFLEISESARDDRSLVSLLAKKHRNTWWFDATDILGTPITAIWHTNGDPVRSIIIAANNRDEADDGTLIKLRDTDCTAGLAGALVGAFHGIRGFPKDWVEDVLGANLELYGIDLIANATALFDVVHGNSE